MDESKTLTTTGSSVPMPPELMELYQLYQQELATRNEKEANYLSELNVMLRSPSMLSLRGPEFDDRSDRDGKLPPIKQEDDPFFLRQDYHRENDYMRSESRMSITSPDSDSTRSSAHTSHLPSIDSDREDSARSLNSIKPERKRKSKSKKHQQSRIPVRSGRSSPRYPDHDPIHFPPIHSARY